MDKVTLRIDGRICDADKGATILEAAAAIRIPIPTLYYRKGIVDKDTSGVCIVEIEGEEELAIASDRIVEPDMKVYTKSPRVMESRAGALRKILAKHNKDCFCCFRTGNCELQELLRLYEVYDDREVELKTADLDESSGYIVRDYSKCIRCGRCTEICTNIQGIGAIAFEGAGLDGRVVATGKNGLGSTNCIHCGQCVAACPVGALYERNDTALVAAALQNPKKTVVAQIAPAVRAALGESFDFPIGVDVEARIAAALRRLGFDRVFDTKFGADLTIMEEAFELAERLKNQGTLPMMTSCCPGWISYCEKYYPELIPNLSTCKSPHKMFGAVLKSRYARELGIQKEDLVVVSIMPCIAKKYDIQRENEAIDVDYSITTKEIAQMLKDAGIDLEAMPTEAFDDPFGMGTGAGVIFGATGGVMEAALRTAVEKLTGTIPEKLEFLEVRGLTGIKEAVIPMGEKNLRVAVCSGLKNAGVLMEKIKADPDAYDFVEVMACPGGCINGGGQPQRPTALCMARNPGEWRSRALYRNDEKSILRKSHENPSIMNLYDADLGEPGSERAHSLLHTSYKAGKII